LIAVRDGRGLFPRAAVALEDEGRPAEGRGFGLAPDFVFVKIIVF